MNNKAQDKYINGVPKLVLNMTDKLYLATAVKSAGKLTFVYTLACLKSNGNQYNLLPTTEIATFDNSRSADMYYKTVLQVMEYQQKNIGPQKIKDMMMDEILKFHQTVR